MKIIYNKYLPVKGFRAINLFGVIFARHGAVIDKRTINHERIHTRQMRELLYVFFYLFYVVEWLIRLVQFRNSYMAYRNISFEREAYANDKDFAYLQTRERFAFIKYIK